MPSTSPLLGDPLPARGRAEGRPSPGLPQGGAEGLGQGARTSRSSPGAPQIRAGGRGVPGQGRIGAPWNQPRSLGLGRPHLHPGTPGSRAGGAHSGPAALTCVHGETSRAARLPRLPPPSGPARLSRAAQVSWCRLLRGLIIDRLDCPRVCQQVAPRAPRRWGPNLRARAPAHLARTRAQRSPGGKLSWRRVGAGERAGRTRERARGDTVFTTQWWRRSKPEPTAGGTCGANEDRGF